MVKRVSLIAYVTPEVRERVEELAKANGLSLSAAAGITVLHGLDHTDLWGLDPREITETQDDEADR